MDRWIDTSALIGALAVCASCADPTASDAASGAPPPSGDVAENPEVPSRAQNSEAPATSNAVPTLPAASVESASFDDTVASGAQANSTVNFGPFREFESRRSVLYVVRETPTGTATRELTFVTEDSIGNRVSLGIPNAEAAVGTWQVRDSGMALFVASMGTDVATAVGGEVAIESTDEARIMLTLSSIAVAFSDGNGNETGRAELDDGWILGKLETMCLYLGPSETGVTVDGQSGVVPTLDEGLTSAFCSRELAASP